MEVTQGWDRKEEKVGLVEEEWVRREEMKVEYVRVLEMEEVVWHEKSRVQL